MTTGIQSLQMAASGNIEPMRCVKVSGDKTVAQGGSNEWCIGISGRSSNVDYDDTKHANTSSLAVEILSPGQSGPAVAGGAITAGALLISDANGKVVAAATTGTTLQEVIGIALRGASADGEIIPVLVNPQKYYPAIS